MSSWPSISLSNPFRCSPEEVDDDQSLNPNPDLNTSSPDRLSPRSSSGVKDDLSELSSTIGHHLRGVACLLSPRPNPNSDDSTSVSDENTQSSSQAIHGIKSDLVEIGDSLKSGLSLVTGISRFASNLLQFQSDGDEAEEDEGETVGITEEIVEFVHQISLRPECWIDFPSPLNNDSQLRASLSSFSLSLALCRFIQNIAAGRGKMSGAGTQKSLRKALGAIKDTTTVSLAKVNSDYKELDIAIVKATNHLERPAKEKYIRAIFAAVSATRPRADVAYCIHALARRLSKTHNWAVALKTLIVIHRALREVDPTFHEELINYGRSRSHMLNLAHFKDDSSPNAWDYSAWVRCYALFLEERLECFRVLKYDVETDRSRTKDLDTPELLEQLPALQQLLFRVLGCQPQGAALHNFVIQLALSMVASESVKIYNAISDGSVNLVDKFFEMQRSDALRALDIYRRAGQQAERLSEFYEICKSLDVGRGERFIKIEQPPASFLQAMEEYVREAPRASTVRKDLAIDDKPKVILALEYKKKPEEQEAQPPSEPEPVPEPEPKPKPEPVKVAAPIVEPPDLLGLNNSNPAASELDEKNAMALAIVPVDAVNQPVSSGPNLANGATGWELALVTAPSSNETATTASKLAGGMDKLTLDSLYEDAMRRSNQNSTYNPWEQHQHHQHPMSNPMMPRPVHHDPFFASNMVAAPPSVQMAAMANQHQAFMLQQQQQQQHTNPFANPYGSTVQSYGSGLPVQPYSNNPYTGLI